MGAGKSTLGPPLAERLGRRFVDLDREVEHASGRPVAAIFAERGEEIFRALEVEQTVRELRGGEPAVLALGGGAVASEPVREALREHAFAILLEVDADEAWRRMLGHERPLARDELRFRALHARRRPLYAGCADARADDLDGAILAAAGVHLHEGALARLGELVPGTGPVALVADPHVAGIHGPDAQLALGPRLAATHELPVGEEAKSVAAYERLLEQLRLDRGGTLVALGGGCTTDAAGFAAATYLRGIPWVPVPTSLVGQIDAGLGGKTALNLATGKNLAGAFHWPARIVVDPRLLETLPQAQRREGLAEAVKTGLLAGEPLWERPDPELVRGCAVYKAGLCLRDPEDRGPRNALNLGHTFAHALEAAGAYGRPTHGEAVALGLRAALALSVEHVGLDADVARTVEEVLAPVPARVDPERAWAALRRDKKAEDGRIRLVLLEAPGRPAIGVELPDADVRAALDRLVAR